MARMTEAEKLARKADRITAKNKAAAGLFAELVPTTTAADVYWKTRRDKARAGEGGGPLDAAVHGLEWIRVRCIERYAAELLGADVAAKLADHFITRADGRGPAYVADNWFGVLTGREAVRFAFEWRDDPTATGGRRFVVTEQFPAAGPVAYITRAEYLDRFPVGTFRQFPNVELPESVEQFDRVMAAIKAGTTSEGNR